MIFEFGASSRLGVTSSPIPRKADYLWSTLSRILSFSKDRSLIASNPCEGGRRLYTAYRTDKVWQDADVAAFLSQASPELALAMMLALWTGQRQGDLLRLPWSAYDGSPRLGAVLSCQQDNHCGRCWPGPNGAAR
jgi:integrase